MALVLKFVTLNFIVPTVKLGHRVLGEILTLKVFGLYSDGDPSFWVGISYCVHHQFLFLSNSWPPLLRISKKPN